MDIIKNFKSKIANAKNVVITTHLIPDADGIGSQIALAMALNSIGKVAVCVNEEPLLDRYRYLDPTNVVIGLDDYRLGNYEDPDLFIVVDTNTIHRIGKHMGEFIQEENTQVLFIDHHPCSEEIKVGQCIDTTQAATGQLTGKLIKSIDVKLTKDMAYPLYTAILIDTSSFRYPTVTAETHSLVSELMEAGVKPPQAYNGIYGTKKTPHIHFLAKVLSTANSVADGSVAWIVLYKEDIEEYDTDIEDTHAFINHLLILDNIRVACMFRDDGDQIKISFRSTGAYDVGNLAISLGGGGHGHSAATLINCPENKDLDKIITETVKKIEKYLKEND